MLGVIFILIISFMPEGLVPGSVRLWGAARWAGSRRGRFERSVRPADRQASDAAYPADDRALRCANRQRSVQIVRRPACHRQCQSDRRAGRAETDHRPQRRRQDHAVQPDHRRARGPTAARSPCSIATLPTRRAATARTSGWRAPIRSSPCSRATRFCATSRWRCWDCRRCAGTRLSAWIASRTSPGAHARRSAE